MRYNRYYIEQHDSNDCGAACLAMVCKYYGKDFSLTGLRDLLGTDIQGTTIMGLNTGAVNLGFTTQVVRITDKVIHDSMTLPAICHVRNEEGASHYVVLMRNEQKKLLILDPARGIVKYSVNEFFEMFDGIIMYLLPTEDFTKKLSEKKSIFGKFAGMVLTQKKLFIYAFVASIILTALGIFFSLFNKILMDEILPYALTKLLISYAIGFGAVIVIRVLLEVVRGQLVLYLSQRIDLPLMTGYFGHVFKLPINFFASRKIGDVTTRFQDAFVVKEVLTNTALTILIDVILAIVTAIIMIVINYQLFLVILIITILSAIIIYSYKGVYKKLNKKMMEQNAKLNGNLIESLKGIETIKVNADEENTIEKIESEYVKVLKTTMSQGTHTNIQTALSGIVTGIGNIVLMSLGVYFAIRGKLTIGTVLSFLTIAGYFLDPIGRLIQAQLSIQEASISLKRLSEIYDIREEEANEEHLQKIKSINQNIRLSNVTFAYGSRSPVLKNISFDIPSGKKTALVGESGSGKTTVSKLLMKFYSPLNGNIFYGDKDIMDINAFSLRKLIGYVPQNIETFSGSINQNIRIGKDDATDYEIENVGEYCGCKEFIQRLPYGYNTFLDENGGGLSGGEKQRIALARALIKHPEFIILDEATSNLDFNTESQIFETLFKKEKKTTMLIIAHRLSTIRQCDNIIVFSHGEIAESGTHDTLMSKKGIYFRMWQTQSGIIEIENNNNEIITENTDKGDNEIEYI